MRCGMVLEIVAWDRDLNPVLPLASSVTKLATCLFVSHCTLTGFAVNDNLFVPASDLSSYIYLFLWIHLCLVGVRGQLSCYITGSLVM